MGYWTSLDNVLCKVETARTGLQAESKSWEPMRFRLARCRALLALGKLADGLRGQGAAAGWRADDAPYSVKRGETCY